MFYYDISYLTKPVFFFQRIPEITFLEFGFAMTLGMHEMKNQKSERMRSWEFPETQEW